MQAVFRLLICLLVSGSLALAVVPAQALIPHIEKASCCAKAEKTEAAIDDCAKHAPLSDQETQCCDACAFGFALFLTPAAPFVYPPLGEESFAAFTARELVRSHRPHVPPPRDTIS